MAKQKQNSNEPVEQANGAYDQALATWIAPRYLRYERHWTWFVCVFGIAAGLAIYGYITDSLTMAVVFAILPFVLVLEHRKKPENVQVVVSEYGIIFGKIRIPYSSMRKFWIIHNPPFVNELHLETGGKLHGEFVIQLMNMDPSSLRQFLVTQVPEAEEKNLGFSEALVRFLRLN